MQTAIYKEDVLPNAMIRDVLVANPQSAKSDVVTDALASRWDPMPDYMLNEIMAGEDSIGGKEIMESQVRTYKHLSNLAKNKLIYTYLNDTTHSWAEDSLIALLQNDDDLKSKYMLAFHLLESEDTSQLNNVLTEIPQSFTLSTSEFQEYQNYLSYFNLLSDLMFDTINNSTPDSLQLAVLFGLSDTCNGQASFYARNLLINMGLVTYNESVYFPTSLYSSIEEFIPDDWINPDKSSSISLFPNPAGNYFIVEFQINKVYKSSKMAIHDINGKLISLNNLDGNLNQIVVPTGDLNSGIYFVSLFVDSRLKDCKKITILN